MQVFTRARFPEFLLRCSTVMPEVFWGEKSRGTVGPLAVRVLLPGQARVLGKAPWLAQDPFLEHRAGRATAFCIRA